MSGFKILFIFYLFAFLSSYHLKATGRYTLPAIRLPHLNGGISLSVFSEGTTSKVAGLLHTFPLMLNVKQESCKYQFLSHWFDRTRNRTSEFTNPETDALSIWPSDR